MQANRHRSGAHAEALADSMAGQWCRRPHDRRPVNRHRGFISVRRPMLTMQARDKLTILIEKCRLYPGLSSTPVGPTSWSNFDACSQSRHPTILTAYRCGGPRVCHVTGNCAAFLPKSRKGSTPTSPLLSSGRFGVPRVSSTIIIYRRRIESSSASDGGCIPRTPRYRRKSAG